MSCNDAYIKGQWEAFNKVLTWINEQDLKHMSKGDLYDAVMDMRPTDLVPLRDNDEEYNAWSSSLGDLWASIK